MNGNSPLIDNCLKIWLTILSRMLQQPVQIVVSESKIGKRKEKNITKVQQFQPILRSISVVKAILQGKSLG